MRKVRTRLFSILLTCAMILGLLPITALAADENWIDSADTSWYTGEGPYTIDSAAELAGLAKLVNEGKETFSGKTINLAADIDLNGKEWTPIGNGTRDGSGYTGSAFKGTFDGNGQTITGLKIIANATGAVDTAYGLFGVVDGGTVEDLTLTGVNINATSGECVGGFIGLMVNDSTASYLTMGAAGKGDTIAAVRGLGGIVGRMTISGTIKDCVNYATISGTGANVGGIVGAAYYTANGSEMAIKNCDNHGVITCSAGVTGGIAGLSAADVAGCENTADITGNGVDVAGIVAEQQNAGSVTNCVNSGNITNNSSAYGTGGIVGWVRYNGATESYGRKEIIEVTNNVNSGKINGGNDGGGIVGTVYNAAVVTGNENTAPSISGTTFAAGIVGNLQFTETPVGTIPTHAVTIRYNMSTTSLDEISAECEDLYVYNNDTAGTAGITIGDNGTAWVAKIDSQKYATLQGAIDAAQDGEIVIVLRNVELTNSLNIAGKKGLTIQGDNKDVTISTNSIAGQKVFSDTPSGAFTLKNLTFTDAIVTINNVTGTVTVDGCTFKNTATTQGDKSGVLNVSGSGTGASLKVKNSTFQNLTRADGTTGAEFVGIYTSGTLDSITVQDSQFKDIAGTALSLRGTGTVSITGNIFDNWADGSNNSEGRAVRVDFSDQKAPTMTFTENKLLPGSQTKESYVKIGEIAGTATPNLNVARNYWGGKDPATATVGEPPVPILEIVVDNDTMTSQELKDQVPGTTSYYKTESMQDQDLSDYVPPVEPSEPPSAPSGDYLVTVDKTTGGKVTVNPGRADKGDTVTITVKPNDGYVLDELTVTAKDGGSVKLTWKDDNKYTFTMPGSQVSIQASFVKEGSEQPVVTLPFTDVTANDWYYDAVEYVYENDLMNGTSATAFSPFVTTSRAMILTILARYDGVDTSAGSTWYEAGAVWAIAKGVSDGTNLEANLTREQLVTMLWRYAGSPVVEGNLADYPDSASVSDWAVNAMIWAVKNGVITGNGAGALNPQGTATRAEVATILMRFIEN